METLIEKKDYTLVNGLLKINEGVRHIPTKCFENCRDIKKIILPSTLISIGDFAFSWCINIKHLQLPDSVKYIMHNAFSYCNIETLLLGRNMKYIAEEAFSHNNIYDVFNNSTKLSFIGQSAFYNNRLKSFNINNYPIFIESHSTELMRISTLSNGRIKLFDAGCDNVIDADCSVDTMDKYSYKDGILKIKDGVQIIGNFSILKDCESVEMPDSVLMILPKAFEGLNYLKNIVFSKNLICIFDKAFSKCSLRNNKIDMPESLCLVDGDPFINNEGENKISLPIHTDLDETFVADKNIYEKRESIVEEEKVSYDVCTLFEEENTTLKELGLLPQTINKNKILNSSVNEEVRDVLKLAFVEYIMSPNYNENCDLTVVQESLEGRAFDISEFDVVVDYLFSRRQYKTIYLFISYGYNYMNKCLISKAIINKMYDMIDILLLLNIDINEIGTIKLTPLSVACKFGNYDVAKYLIEKGAAINMIDANNKMPIDYAEESNSIAIIDLINSYKNQNERTVEEDILILSGLM